MSDKYTKEAVKYNKDWEVRFEGTTPILLPTCTYKAVVRSHTKRYHNCLYALAGIGSCARDLMDYMTEQMDDTNHISTNKYLRDKFITFIKQTTEKKDVNGVVVDFVEYSDSSVKRALRILTEKHLIRQVQKGVCLVNPEFFWKNNEDKRMGMVRVELEFSSGSDTKMKVLQDRHDIKDANIVSESDERYELVKREKK